MDKKKSALIIATLLSGLTSTMSFAQVDCSIHASWQSEQVYNNGDTVQHQGQLYSAKWWTQGNTPQPNQTHSVWRDLGACDGSGTSPDPITPPVEPPVTPPTEPPVEPPVVTPPVDRPNPSCSAYQAGNIYKTGDQVYSGLAGSFECLVGAWCSLDTAAYQPGVGSASSLAWKQIPKEQCSAPIIPPAGPETNPPGSPRGVLDPDFPAHALVGDWINARTYSSHNFIFTCPERLIDVANELDVINVAGAALPFRSDISRLEFSPFPGAAPKTNYNGHVIPGCDALDPAVFKQDIAALQAQGKVVLLAFRSPELAGYRSTDENEQAFVSSAINLIEQWGFDGMSLRTYGIATDNTRLIRAIRTIDNHFSQTKFFTAGRAYNLYGSELGDFKGTEIRDDFINLFDNLRDVLDLVYVEPMGYTQSLNAKVEQGVPAEYNALVKNRIVTMANQLINGFADGTEYYFHGLRPDQISIMVEPREVAIYTTNRGHTEGGNAREGCLKRGGTTEECRAYFAEIMPEQALVEAIQCITQGLYCDNLDAGGIFPDLNGVLIHDTGEEKRRGNRLITPVSALLNGQ